MEDSASGREPVRAAGESPQRGRERAGPGTPKEEPQDRLGVEVVAAVLAIIDHQPRLLLARNAPGPQAALLPSTLFVPTRHETLETALRAGLPAEAGRTLVYLEQLAADCRHGGGEREQGHSLTIGYLGLLRADAMPSASLADWLRIYELLPWEDWRKGRPKCLADEIVPKLLQWAAAASAEPSEVTKGRLARVRIAFGLHESAWDDERVVERLDLIDEAGLLPMTPAALLPLSHCRIAAGALGRLRAKIRHRPVVFELLPTEFTLFELQRAVEAVLGPNLHKQNFRRLVEGMGLVEPTGEVKSHTGGRPARLFRFRPQVMLERSAPGMRIRPGKAA